MKIALIEYGPDKISHRRIKILICIVIVMQVAVYWMTSLNLVVLLLVIPGLSFREFLRVGTVKFNGDSIDVGCDNQVYSCNLEELRLLRLDYPNPWRSRGKYCWYSPNYLTVVPKEGLERKYQILIDGKRLKRALKEVLQKYKNSGVEVEIKSKVAASWLEF